MSKDNAQSEDTIIPEGIERVHPRYAEYSGVVEHLRRLKLNSVVGVN